MENEENEVSPEEMADIFNEMLDAGYITVVGMTDNGEPLYKFSEEVLAMEEFYEIHEAIVNDILFSIWNKGFIEMFPLNEDGDWRIELNDKSGDMSLAKQELAEDEFILFVQLYEDLRKSEV